MKWLVIALALCTMPVSSLAQVKNPWVGTWQSDPAKRQLNYSFSYTQTPDGVMHYVDGAEVTNFRIDGKAHTSQGIHTSTWTAAGPNTWDTIHKAGSVFESKTHRVLSADNKTLTMTTDGNEPDGSTYHDLAIFTRVSGTTGLLGTWRSTTMKTSSADRLVILPSPPGMYHSRNSEEQSEINGKTDGSDIPIKGPRVSPGATISMRAVSSHVFTYAVKSGQMEYDGVQRLAEDEQTFTDTSWTKGKEDEKSTAYYSRK